MYQYVLKEGNDPLFTFKTKHGLNYFVAFRKMDFVNKNFQNLYSLDFWEMENQKFQKDNSIENTIIDIIFHFFKNNPSALLHYVCDSIDKRHNQRSKLFEKWYNKSTNNEFSKLDIVFNIDANTNYNLEFIFKSEFYNIDLIKEDIIAQLDEFSNFK